MTATKRAALSQEVRELHQLSRETYGAVCTSSVGEAWDDVRSQEGGEGDARVRDSVEEFADIPSRDDRFESRSAGGDAR